LKGLYGLLDVVVAHGDLYAHVVAAQAVSPACPARKFLETKRAIRPLLNAPPTVSLEVIYPKPGPVVKLEIGF
ncbi:MAG: hypothetical protein LBE49_09250, partial [Deltaproteobacteria bacterium]|nr:hypothetical protein [Deltaproteobacteria bacterium]